MARYKGKQYYSPKRRAVYRKGHSIDHLTLFHLFGWECNICLEEINPKKRFPDLDAATVDHIVPLAQGGSHTWDNVRPAHARCNFSKGCEALSITGLDNTGVVLLDLSHAG